MSLHTTLLALLLTLNLTAQKPVHRKVLLPPGLVEISGLARTPGGDIWALADSGNPPVLYKLDVKTGVILETRTPGIRNRDWEELSCSGEGVLFIGDFGNNLNRRKDLRIYRFDPVTGGVDSILFVYPDQSAFPPATDTAKHFDCEAMVWFNDSLHLFTKSRFRGDCITRHYTLPDRPGVYRANLKDSLLLTNRVVTGAALSPDGRTLVLTSYITGAKLGIFPFSKASAFFFTGFQDGYFLRGQRQRKRLPKCLLARQFESVCWYDARYWLAANEGNRWQRARVWRIILSAE